MKPQVSVVMPAYNAEKYIEEAIRSVLAQTYPSLELIVINDNSSDSTPEIVQTIASQDKRVILYTSGSHLGVSEARNTGVSIARGEWIAFLDSDDAWETDKLEKQIRLAAQTNGELLFTGSAFMDEAGRRIGHVLRVPQTIAFKQLLNQNLISCSSVLIKREIMLKYKMKYDQMHEDFAVWLQYLQTGKAAYGINEPLLIYRISATSKSSDKRKAAQMTWRVYRYIGLGYPSCIYHMIQYTLRSLIKYGRIKGK